MLEAASTVRMGRWVVVTLMLALAPGCGGSDPEGGTGAESIDQTTALSYEGIYELTLLTENTTSCEGAGGDLTSSSDPYFLLVASEGLGQWIVDMYSCLAVADCQSKAAAARARMGGVAIGYGATLSSEVTPDELTGFAAGSGFQMGGMCVDREYDEHRLSRSGDSLTLQSTTKALADKPPEDGLCWARPQQDRKEAASAPCVASRAVVGTWVAAL